MLLLSIIVLLSSCYNIATRNSYINGEKVQYIQLHKRGGSNYFWSKIKDSATKYVIQSEFTATRPGPGACGALHYTYSLKKI